VEELRLGGASGDTVCGIQFPQETVGQADSVSGLCCSESLAHGVGDVAGEDIRGVVVINLCEDSLQPLVQSKA
jgi:hypothetical protein